MRVSHIFVCLSFSPFAFRTFGQTGCLWACREPRFFVDTCFYHLFRCVKCALYERFFLLVLSTCELFSCVLVAVALHALLEDAPVEHAPVSCAVYCGPTLPMLELRWGGICDDGSLAISMKRERSRVFVDTLVVHATERIIV